MLSSIHLLRAAGVIAVALASTAPGHAQESAASGPEKTGAELVILGTAAGRTSYGGHPSGGFSAAVVVGQDRYIVDFGRGWHDRYYEAGLGTPAASSGFSGLEGIRAGFISHLHADHTVDLPRLLLFGSVEGARRRKEPVALIGPGPRGVLPPRSASIKEDVQLVHPENPTPGLSDTIKYMTWAFAADINDTILDSGLPNPNTYIKVSEIQLPKGLPGPEENPSPPMDPIEVYRDNQVRVTAVLVNHAPMYPTYAFRFDTPGGSVVFSGDTNKNQNLIRLAKGADVLVHEVISPAWANGLFPSPKSPAQEAMLTHLLEAHTPADQVGSVAAEAGVGTLVLAHLAPPTVSDEDWLKQVNGFSGKVLVGRPLTRVKLRAQ